MKNITPVLTASFLVLCSSVALAQTAGTYSGTSADGQALSFTVSAGGSGNMVISSVSGSYATTSCKKQSVAPFSSGIGYDPNAAIGKSGKVSYVEEYVFAYQAVKGVFSGDTFSGTIYSSSPTLILPPNNAKPNSTTICFSPSQAFSTTLGEDANAAAKSQLAKVLLYTIKK